MIAIVMAGGKGSRFGYVEKPMVRLGGIPLIDHVMRALLESGLETYIATSKNTPKTEAYCRSAGYRVVVTDGSGYHEDLQYLTERFGVIITCASDIPFLTPRHIEPIIRSSYGSEDSVVGCTLVDGKVTPFGLNLVHGPDDRYIIFDDPYVGVNINSSNDLDLAAKIYEHVDYNRAVRWRFLEEPRFNISCEELSEKMEG